MGTDHRGSFLTHTNYLRAFATLCGYYPRDAARAVVLPRMATRIRATLGREARTGAIPLDDVRRSLVNAWGTEFILALSGRYATEEELLRLVNNCGRSAMTSAALTVVNGASMRVSGSAPDASYVKSRHFLFRNSRLARRPTSHVEPERTV
jgi:hypothetical protein